VNIFIACQANKVELPYTIFDVCVLMNVYTSIRAFGNLFITFITMNLFRNLWLSNWIHMDHVYNVFMSINVLISASSLHSQPHQYKISANQKRVWAESLCKLTTLITTSIQDLSQSEESVGGVSASSLHSQPNQCKITANQKRVWAESLQAHCTHNYINIRSQPIRRECGQSLCKLTALTTTSVSIYVWVGWAFNGRTLLVSLTIFQSLFWILTNWVCNATNW